MTGNSAPLSPGFYVERNNKLAAGAATSHVGAHAAVKVLPPTNSLSEHDGRDDGVAVDSDRRILHRDLAVNRQSRGLLDSEQ